MSNHEHPWVQDFGAYEAVLCSSNEVHGWDQQATLRAYQTYGFDDASTPGNDQAYKHFDTGLMLLHDGDVVAIQFGDGNLPAALSDLFMVLNALGWKRAEVFHPAETMGALLTDMGRAIPAHMEFDVFAAKLGVDTPRLPEAEALVERGRNLLQGVAANVREVAEFNELALGELESMGSDPGEQAAMSQHPVPETPERQAIAVVAAPRTRVPVFLEDDYEPTVPVLGDRGAGAVSRASEQPQYVAEAPPEGWDDPLSFEGEPAGRAQPAPFVPKVVDAEHRDPSLRPAVHVASAASVHEEEVDFAPATQLERCAEPSPVELQRAACCHADAIVRVGRSAFCFDLPGRPVDQQRVRDLATELGAEDVVDLWPGAVGQAARWDVLGEIDIASPWFAELLAGAILRDAAHCACLAADMMELVRGGTQPQLRGLVRNVLEGKGAASGYLTEPSAIEYRTEVVKSLGGVFLAQDGDGFVDLSRQRSDVAEDATQAPCADVFRVRSLAESFDAKVYVIHRDAIDGRFVEFLVGLLQHVAAVYAQSDRVQKQSRAIEAERMRREDSKRAAQEREEQKLRAAATIRETMAGLAVQLRELGVEVAISAA